MTDYWEVKLRAEASMLPSLRFFRPEYMSLARPHPLWTTTESNPYEVAKAVQQARFLSGRYRTESLCRHWTANTMGLCLCCSCKIEESIDHILLFCPAYQGTRQTVINYWIKRSRGPALQLVLEAIASPSVIFLQFLLDCSSLPPIITATQLHGQDILSQIFHLTRTWCFAIHRERMKMLGRWNFS